MLLCNDLVPSGQMRRNPDAFSCFHPQNINFGDYISHVKRALHKSVHVGDSS